MANMEDLLMLSGDSSGSDSDDDGAPPKASGTQAKAKSPAAPKTAKPKASPNKPKQSPPPVVAAPKPKPGGGTSPAPGPPRPGVVQRTDSKSALTSRLRGLYQAPVPKGANKAGAKAKPAAGVGGGAALAPPRRTSGGVVVPSGSVRGGGVAVGAPPPVAQALIPPGAPPGGAGGNPGGVAAPPAAGGGYVPPMVHTSHARGSSSPVKQSHAHPQHGRPGQQPQVMGGPPGSVPQVGRVPAPLPKARTARSHPPSNRVASVPTSVPAGVPSRPGGGPAPLVNVPSVGPPPPSPLTTTSAAGGQHHPQQGQQQQPPSRVAGGAGRYAHAPHLRGGTSSSSSGQHRAAAGGTSSRGGQRATQQQPTAVPGGSSRGGAPGVVRQERSSGSAHMTEQEKKEKERFLMFTRVLMKYLEQRDTRMHAAAKAQIKECYEKNKSGDPQFKSLTTSMKARLRRTVGESYWKKAHDYLDHFLKQKRISQHQRHHAAQQAQGGGGGQGQAQAQAPPQQQQQMVGGGGHPSQHGAAPPPIVRTADPRQSAAAQHQQHQQHQQQQQQQAHGAMTQARMSAATKTPLASGSRPAPAGSAPPATIPVAVPPAGPAAAPSSSSSMSSMSAQLTPEQVEAQKKKAKAEELAKKKKERNEKARKARAEKRKKEQQAAKLAKEQERAAAAAAKGGTTATTTAAGAKAAGGTTTAATTAKGALPTGVGIPHPLQQRSGSIASSSSAATVGSSGNLLAATTAAGTPSSASVASTGLASAASSKAKDKKADPPAKKKATKRKSSTGSASSKASSALAKRKSLTREPSKLMETIDHACMIDVKSLPTLLSKEHKLDFNLDKEQRALLYGSEERRQKVRTIAEAAAAALDVDAKDAKSKEASPQAGRKIPARLEGWGTRNVVSARTAWARVRLPEVEARRLEREREVEAKAKAKGERTGGAISTDPERVPSSSASSGAASQTSQEGAAADDGWPGEAGAEHDPTLVLLSEAAEAYLRSTIEGAVGRARLRQNLDGVRLWHTLHAGANGVGGPKAKPPAASLRLGCDVRRQVALAEGNAAKTYQRMEEALSRRREDAYPTPDAACDDIDSMLLEATSMGDLSKKVPLKSAVQVADLDAKRKFAVYGGIDSQEPPFGRVPKKAKVLLQDIVVGELGNRKSMIQARRRGFRVGLKY